MWQTIQNWKRSNVTEQPSAINDPKHPILANWTIRAQTNEPAETDVQPKIKWLFKMGKQL